MTLPQPAKAPPLCVDLDGTLVATDLLWESLLALVRARRGSLLQLPLCLLRGRAYLKRRIAEQVTLNHATLPLRPEVVELVRQRRQAGGRTILATASDEILARSLADHLALFDDVVASDGRENLKGRQKLERLHALLGGARFDYVGDSRADLPLWRAAAGAWVVAPGPGLARRVREAQPRHTILGTRRRIAPLVRALRPHQWAKNVLVFVPLVMGQQAANLVKLGHAIACFVALCVCASAVYLLNDLLDIESDRRHPTKRRRPIASGELPIPAAAAAAVILLFEGLALSGALLSWTTTAMLLLYVAVTTAYSLDLKRRSVVDVLTLAGLYTLRIFAGGVATNVRVSSWLLTFSLYLFLSLAFAKRYTELVGLQRDARAKVPGRGYRATDVELVRVVGPASGLLASLVFVLYVNSSPDVARNYPSAWLLYLVSPVILYWITRIWFLAQRQHLSDDPVVFALRDGPSLVSGTVIVILFALASLRIVP